MNVSGCLARKCRDNLRKRLTHRKTLIEVGGVAVDPFRRSLLDIELAPLMFSHAMAVGLDLAELLDHAQTVVSLLTGQRNSRQPVIAVTAAATNATVCGEGHRQRRKGKTYGTAGGKGLLYTAAQARQIGGLWQTVIIG